MKNKSQIKVGKPTDSLPETSPLATKKSAPYWEEAAQAVRARPGMWVPITIPHLTVKRHQHCMTDVKKGKIYAFRDTSHGTYDAAYRQGQLYIKYTPKTA